MNLAVFQLNLNAQRSNQPTKQGNIADINNYQPLIVVSPLLKIIDAVINSFANFLEKHYLLISTQFGFRRGKSNIQAATKLVTEILESFGKREILSTVFLDLSKTFDSVPHDILTYKLYVYGIRGSILELIKSKGPKANDI